MTHPFDKDYWESHWQGATGHGPGGSIGANPYLARETATLLPGTALDAGCGEGAEAIWLANEGWRVTAADISTEALSLASARAESECTGLHGVQWVEADLCTWEPGCRFDLVTTHYAHPAMAQLAFYQRIANWVAPGGTLLIVGHQHAAGHGHGPQPPGHGPVPPDEATVSASSITMALDAAQWDVVTAIEPVRSVTTPGDGSDQLADVVVRALRRP